jgi:hypothetical protein
VLCSSPQSVFASRAVLDRLEGESLRKAVIDIAVLSLAASCKLERDTDDKFSGEAA